MFIMHAKLSSYISTHIWAEYLKNYLQIQKLGKQRATNDRDMTSIRSDDCAYIGHRVKRFRKDPKILFRFRPNRCLH